MEQHHRAGLDLGLEHVGGRSGVGVVDPVERYDVPIDIGQALPFGLRQHLVVDQPARGTHQIRALTRRRLDRVAGLAELRRDVLRRDRRHVGVFPRVAADLHARVGDSLGACGVGRDLVADQEERRLRVVVTKDLQQPVGVRARPVVERQRDTLDLCAVDGVGIRPPDVAGDAPTITTMTAAPTPNAVRQ